MKKGEIITVVSLIVIFFTGVTAAYFITRVERQLPIINPSDLNPDIVPDSLEGQGLHHRIRDFVLLDQRGNVLTLDSLREKIYVADFFFTACPSICIDMAGSMRRLQEEFKDEDRLVLVSHSVTPVADSVEVLAEYADRNGAIYGKWFLLTGEKEVIYDLARTNYFAVLDPDAYGEEHDFIHTENFVLVDQDKKIRGVYAGTNPQEIDLLINDIHLLLNQQ
ncbi:MAG: SCO family protein [Bacteroidota bacterium]|nr:SCO family protein [Bacteroidota bacterium]MDX5449322.1 SCO family protein [Bacteroidota bacterium]MDX5506072.1 SCO family protein [Bacteroidota bacterium]